jgi:hypothetical protein
VTALLHSGVLRHVVLQQCYKFTGVPLPGYLQRLVATEVLSERQNDEARFQQAGGTFTSAPLSTYSLTVARSPVAAGRQATNVNSTNAGTCRAGQQSIY